MAFLSPWAGRAWRCYLTALGVVGMLGCLFPAAAAQGAPKEYQVKAAFLFNFAQFVDWPAGAFATTAMPVTIGVLGDDPFGAYLDELVRGERVHDRSLRVERYRRVEEIGDCHVLFISRSEAGRLDQILEGLKDRPILTVGDFENFARRGGMIRLITEKNKIRMRISQDAAVQAGLTISSKLLRASELVGKGKD